MARIAVTVRAFLSCAASAEEGAGHQEGDYRYQLAAQNDLVDVDGGPPMDLVAADHVDAGRRAEKP
ncbi:hypothetical protein Aco03nite_057320 [Actinoplanes couchii]|uniref:Secreted protein n=1 Tax=Actinoplanes couchii TaxID=403638 RepID=A0ABQ3XFP9_9ACTN|nr:hypothetical protein Aco03nite_057320 [Actinoplanes couchii]